VAPISVLTGEVPRWDKVRVFGSTVYEHKPNNSYAKVPGVPKGRKLIFVGFSDNKIGFRVFFALKVVNIGRQLIYIFMSLLLIV